MVLIFKKAKPAAPPVNPFPEIEDPLGYGQRAVDFLRGLKHPKSRLPDRAFQLDPWQERIVRQIYGPRNDDGERVVSTVVMLLPRGSRKTSLAAALSLLHTSGPEAVAGGEVLIAATDRTQASIAFKEAEGIIVTGGHMWRKGQANRRFDAASDIKLLGYKNSITFPNGSSLRSISSEAGSAHGSTPNLCLVDELHAWPKRDLWDVIKTGLAKIAGSLLIVITTAGRGQENIAFDVIEYSRKVARGEIDDPAWLPVLYETSRDADWKDEAVWHAANPGLALGYPDIKALRRTVREVEARPAEREAFRQLHLNVWRDHSADPFLEMSIYDKGKTPIAPGEFDGRACWVAVDMGLTMDLTAVVACFRDGEDGFAVIPHFFCPGDNLQARADRDGVPYPLWAEAGFITPTPGNVTDYRTVENHVRDLCERYAVREIAFDPAYAQAVMTPLTEDGYPTITMRQGWLTMSPAVKELERAIISGRFRHGGHPVLRWNFDNISVETDKAGNKTFHKGKSKDRIDGAQAAAMAVARAAAGEDDRSVYDTEDRPEGLLVF